MRHPQWLGKSLKFSVFQPRNTQSRPPKLRPRTELEIHEDSAVDLILDKISRDGFQSLTDAEREILQQASKRK
jgi:hypothetical protein